MFSIDRDGGGLEVAGGGVGTVVVDEKITSGGAVVDRLDFWLTFCQFDFSEVSHSCEVRLS